jgi:hypothetical protein
MSVFNYVVLCFLFFFIIVPPIALYKTIRLLRNLKKQTEIDESFTTSTKPSLLRLICFSLCPIILIGTVMILAYNPVKDVPISDEYFQSTRFDFDHPKYGSTEPCKKLEDAVSDMKDMRDFDGYNSSH